MSLPGPGDLPAPTASSASPADQAVPTDCWLCGHEFDTNGEEHCPRCTWLLTLDADQLRDQLLETAEALARCRRELVRLKVDLELALRERDAARRGGY